MSEELLVYIVDCKMSPLIQLRCRVLFYFDVGIYIYCLKILEINNLIIMVMILTIYILIIKIYHINGLIFIVDINDIRKKIYDL